MNKITVTTKDRLEYEMGQEEMRACRRELINWHLQNKGNNFRIPEFALRDLLFLVRNGEMYRYGCELQAYK